jgi:hypothetical protein
VKYICFLCCYFFILAKENFLKKKIFCNEYSTVHLYNKLFFEKYVIYLSISMLSWTRAETLLASKALRAPCRSLEKKIGAGPLACGLSKRAAPTSQVCSSTTATLSSIMMGDPSTVDTGAGRVCNCKKTDF